MSKKQLHPLQLRRPRHSLATRRSLRQLPSTVAANDTPLPFRWEIARRESLGGILEDRSAGLAKESSGQVFRINYPGFQDALLACTARVLALAGDSDLVFVGRAPESLFDLLSGLLADTSWRRAQGQRLTLLRYSTGRSETAKARRKQPEVMAAFRAYMDSLGLSPEKLIVRERPIALVDLICGGTTMNQLLLLIQEWALEEKRDWPAVRRKLRVVGIARRYDETPPRPRWRQRKDGVTIQFSWHDEAQWVEELLERGALREFAVPSTLWDFLGDWQTKTTPSYSPEDWGEEVAARPRHEEYYLVGLRAARQLFEIGCEQVTRKHFAELLAAEEVGMREVHCRRLVREIRKR